MSGQLHVESYACALSNVCKCDRLVALLSADTFGPTFRSEKSHTARHAAEFWMIEPEIAFADLADDMVRGYRRLCGGGWGLC